MLFQSCKHNKSEKTEKTLKEVYTMKTPWKLPVKILLLTACLLLPLAACSSNRNPNVQQKGTGMQPVPTINPTASAPGQLRYQIADHAANQIATFPEVSQANVLVTNRNAYVAVVLHHNQEYTPDLENRITAQVRSQDPAIDNVYISANPDFVGRVNTYVNDVRNGRPVSGLVTELSDTIYRLFPKAR
jgi:YhcN/YlaJ family sporulation lipoprotein